MSFNWLHVMPLRFVSKKENISPKPHYTEESTPNFMPLSCVSNSWRSVKRCTFSHVTEKHGYQIWLMVRCICRYSNILLQNVVLLRKVPC
jgi:hypothetical protein